ncbi:hypothetical protein Tco_1104784 [Tanacetum coccineum]
MLDNTCYWMGSTAVANNANDVLLCQQHSCGLCGVTIGRTLLFASSSNIFDSISKIYKDHYQSLHDYLFLKSQDVLETAKCLGIDVPFELSHSGLSPTKERIGHLAPLGREEQEAKENVALVDEHLASEEIEKMVEGPEKCLLMIVQSLGMINSNIPDKHIKEQVMKQVPEQVRNQVPVYVAEGLILERQKAKEETERLIAKAILQEYQQYQLYLAMKADPQLQQQDIAIWLALQMKFEERRFTNKLHWQCGKKTSECELYVSGESIVWTSFQEEQAPSTSGNQEQDDDFDFWTNSYALDNDEIPTKQVSHDIMEEVLLTIDEAKLRKMADEMLRQRCNFMKMSNQVITLDSMKILEEWTLSGRVEKKFLVLSTSTKTTPISS